MSNGTLVTDIMQIPGADKALAFLQSQLAAFSYLPVRLDRTRRVLEAVRAAAATQTDAWKVAASGALLDGLAKLNTSYANTSGHVSALLNALRGSTVRAGVLVPQLLGVVADMSLLFRSMDVFEQGAKDLEAGTLSPAEITRLRAGGYTMQNAVVNPLLRAALLVGGLWLLWRLVRGR